ncbi:MAG: hypothetical protein ACKOSO_08060, partial [Actinomycetota bacterium]
ARVVCGVERAAPGGGRGVDRLVHVDAVVEVPCLGAQWRPLRRWIDGGMASGIGQPAILARTITVYGDTGRIVDALAAGDRERVQARVARRTGEVLAEAAGEPTGAGWDRIAAALG